jgi:hypothetical protein
MATMLLFYILQKKYLNKSCIIFEYLLPYITPRSKIKWQYYPAHLTSLHIHHVNVDCGKWKHMMQSWPPLGKCSYQFHENQMVHKLKGEHTSRHRSDFKSYLLSQPFKAQYTVCSIIINLCIFTNVYFRVLYNSKNEQWLFPWKH